MLADKVKGYFTHLIITQRGDHKISKIMDLHHPILILRVFTLLICT